MTPIDPSTTATASDPPEATPSTIQATTIDGAEYEPLVDVKGLLCWPDRPRYDQLVQGAELEDLEPVDGRRQARVFGVGSDPGDAPGFDVDAQPAHRLAQRASVDVDLLTALRAVRHDDPPTHGCDPTSVRDPASARPRLEEIVKDYAGTRAALEAAALLEGEQG